MAYITRNGNAYIVTQDGNPYLYLTLASAMQAFPAARYILSVQDGE